MIWSDALENLWASAFALLSPFARLRATDRVWPRDQARVLVLAPHPDDETSAAGALIAHRRAGHAVHVLIVTDGAASRSRDLSPREMADLRARESEQARAILDLEPERWERLGLTELSWPSSALEARLRALLADFAPDLIYAPSAVDGHPDHLRVAQVLARALDAAGASPRVRCYQVQIPLTPFLTNLALDVSADRDQLLRVFAAYASQSESLQRTLRPKRYAARLYGARALAEEFWELDARAFTALHLHARPAAYAGLGLRAFRDPLAYLAGTRERLRLAGGPGRADPRYSEASRR